MYIITSYEQFTRLQNRIAPQRARDWKTPKSYPCAVYVSENDDYPHEFTVFVKYKPMPTRGFQQMTPMQKNMYWEQGPWEVLDIY